jgi:hypothetical protein
MENVADELVELVTAVSQRLEKIREEEASARPSPNEWTKKEIVGHLIDSATNNHQRYVRAQLEDELVFPAYEQEEWVRVQVHNGSSWEQLVSLWRLYNLHLAHVVRQISSEKLETPCRIGSYETVTLGYLVEDYLVHTKQHVKQLGL